MRRERWWSCADVRRPFPGAVALITLWLLALPPARAMDLGDGLIRLRNVTYAADPSAPGAPRLPPSREAEADHPLDTWIVAFDGRRDEDVRENVARADGRIVGYVPSSAYLVRGSAATAQALRAAPAVLRVDRLRAEWRVSPDLDRDALATGGTMRAYVDVFEAGDVEAVAAAARAAGVEVLRADRVPARLIVTVAPAQVDRLAALSGVEWIEPAPDPVLRNDNTRWIIQSNDEAAHSLPLYDEGLLGEGEIIGHIDSAPGTTHCFFVDSVIGDPGPDHRKLVRNDVSAGPGQHGSHTAGTACGENEDPAFPGNRGMAPKARLSHIDFGLLTGDYNGQPSNLYHLLRTNHDTGARIHTNSWGFDGSVSYTDWCVDTDAFSSFYEDDLVVFACTNLDSLHTPENAKNCLSVGASQGPGFQDSIWRGGTGPTIDGRRKPELFAPGRNVISANSSGCFLFSLSGTSMAAPAVAGGAALVREYYRRGFYPTGRAWAANGVTPTGALLKATVINSAADMTNEPGYPGAREGWGRILLDDALYFNGESRRLWMRDIRHEDGLRTDGERQWGVRVLSSDEPLAVTMAFMDVPATQLAFEAAVNDLDLEVSGPDGVFLGNVLDTGAGVSLTGGSPDPRNNVERVLVAAPTPGFWTISVRGASVPYGPQGFAVVANGAFPSRGAETNPARNLDPPPPGQPMPAPGPAWRLDAPRPTPFRGSADVPFAIPRDARVTIRVHDVSGRMIRVLLDDDVTAGDHVETWDGRTDDGAPAGPGVYLLRLTAPGVTRSVRTVLLR